MFIKLLNNESKNIYNKLNKTSKLEYEQKFYDENNIKYTKLFRGKKFITIIPKYSDINEFIKKKNIYKMEDQKNIDKIKKKGFLAADDRLEINIQSLETLDKLLGKKRNTGTKILSLLSNVVKKKKTKSEREKMIDALIKNRKVQNPEDAKKFLQSKGYSSVTNDEANYYYQMATLTFPRFKRFGLLKDILRGKIIVPIVIQHTTYFLTNDSLYWEFFKQVIISNKVENNKQYFFNKVYADCLDIESVDIASTDLITVADGETKIFTECYVEDLQRFFACPNYVYKDMPKFKPDDVSVDQVKGSFLYNGKAIFVYNIDRIGPNNRKLIIFSVDQNKEKICEYLNKIKQIKPTKKVLENGVKEIAKKLGHYYYFTQNLTVTDFCPCTLDLPTSSNFYIKLNCVLDCEKMMESAQKYLKEFKIAQYFFNWESFDNVMVFMSVVFLVFKGENNAMEKVYESYNESKPAFSKYKLMYLFFKKIVLGFIDSCTNKINIGRLNAIRNDCVSFLEGLQTLVNNASEYNQIFQLITALGNDVNLVLLNFVKETMLIPRGVISMIKECCSLALDVGSKSSEIETKFRSTGVEAFGVLVGGGRTPIINAIRSPYSYLGNLTGNMTNDQIKTIILLMKSEITKALNSEEAAKKAREETRIVLSNEISKRLASGQSPVSIIGNLFPGSQTELVKKGYLDLEEPKDEKIKKEVEDKNVIKEENPENVE